MKKILILLTSIICLTAYDSMAQTEFMHITTMESVVGGGLGRSRMLITNADGTQLEKNMSNLFSMVGVNMGNIKRNEIDILEELTKYTNDGWTLITTIPKTFGGDGSGIFMTRYLLSRTRD